MCRRRPCFTVHATPPWLACADVAQMAHTGRVTRLRARSDETRRARRIRCERSLRGSTSRAPSGACARSQASCRSCGDSPRRGERDGPAHSAGHVNPLNANGVVRPASDAAESEPGPGIGAPGVPARAAPVDIGTAVPPGTADHARPAARDDVETVEPVGSGNAGLPGTGAAADSADRPRPAARDDADPARRMRRDEGPRSAVPDR